MDTKIGATIAAIILAVFLADHLYFGWDLWIFAMKKLWQLMTWMAFWR